MRIGFIADLHMDYNLRHDFIDSFARACDTMELDVIVFAGDTTTGVVPALNFYSDLQAATPTKVLQVPGNHELYCLASDQARDQGEKVCLDADETMDLLLNHPRFSLFRQPIVHHGWCVIGGPSWYDYSLHQNFFRMDRFSKQRFLRRNPEYKYIQGSRDNPFINEKITAQSLILMEKQLKTIRNRPGGRKYKICSVTHMLPLPEMYESKHIFSTTVAFMGSRYYAELYAQYGVDLAICGHSHMRKDLVKDGTQYVNVSLGHNFSWKHKTSLYEEIQGTAYVLEI